MHMNVMVVFFSLLPFALFYSISYARKKEYKKHFISQSFILGIALVVLVYFEIMIRIDGGFFEFSKHSNMSEEFLIKYLIFHIAIALIAAILWIGLFIKTYMKYKNGKLEQIVNSSHKTWGKISALFITLSCITGVFVYLFLFIF